MAIDLTDVQRKQADDLHRFITTLMEICSSEEIEGKDGPIHGVNVIDAMTLVGQTMSFLLVSLPEPVRDQVFDAWAKTVRETAPKTEAWVDNVVKETGRPVSHTLENDREIPGGRILQFTENLTAASVSKEAAAIMDLLGQLCPPSEVSLSISKIDEGQKDGVPSIEAGDALGVLAEVSSALMSGAPPAIRHQVETWYFQRCKMTPKDLKVDIVSNESHPLN